MNISGFVPYLANLLPRQWKGLPFPSRRPPKPYVFPKDTPPVIQELAIKAWDVELVRRLRVARANLEHFINARPAHAEGGMEIQTIAARYVVAVEHRLINLGIEPKSDRSFLEAETLHRQQDFRKLPYLRKKYIE